MNHPLVRAPDLETFPPSPTPPAPPAAPRPRRRRRAEACRREHRMRPERRPPLALGDVTQREPEPLALDADNDQAEAGPGVEPAVQEPQLGRSRWELEEAEARR